MSGTSNHLDDVELYAFASDAEQLLLPDPTGGRTTRPTRSRLGSSELSIVSIPDFALFSFVQLGSFAPLQVSHIEPVRSKTATMSAGRSAHGPHAVERTWIEIVSTPKRRRKNVVALPDSSTTTALFGAQPGSDVTHFSETVCWTPVMPLLATAFLEPGVVPYCAATPDALAASGSCDAPASAAASAEL